MLKVFVSPPPETVTVFETVAGALLATFTDSVMGKYVAPPLRASLRVQGPEGCAQVHPVPPMAVAVSPVGNNSVTVTVPLVGTAPLLKTVME